MTFNEVRVAKRRGWYLSAVVVGATAIGIAGTVVATEPDWGTMPYTSHAAYQAIDANGNGTFPVSAPVRMRGVVLNRPQDMLLAEPDATAFMGGQWQVFLQTVDDGDFGGTAMWMGQNIGKTPMGLGHPQGSYTPRAWLTELDRLDFGDSVGHRLRPGDLVEVRARAPGFFHAGKTNVNEQHVNIPEADFEVVVLDPNYGLPAPAVLTLSDVKDENDLFIFDATRQTGCERYQATLVTLTGVSFVDTSNWGPNAMLAVQDGAGRTFPVNLGLGRGFSAYPALTGTFDITGILNQEDGNQDDGFKDSYRLWVMDYDGVDFFVPAGPNVTHMAGVCAHGAAGEFAVDLSRSAGLDGRVGGPQRLDVSFDQAVAGSGTGGAVTVADVAVTPGSVTAVAVAGTELSITVEGIGDSGIVAVAFPGIVSVDQGAAVGRSQFFTVLAGDATGDKAVNIFDLVQVRNQLNQPVTAANFRADVNVDGAINIFDLVAVRNRLNSAVE